MSHVCIIFYYVTGKRSLQSDCQILLWDVGIGFDHDIDILPRGNVIAACGDDGLRVYDKKSGQKIQHPISDMCNGDIRGVSVGDYGAAVAAVESRRRNPGVLHIYTSVSGCWKHQMHNTCEKPRSMASTNDGHFIVGGLYNSMYKYDTQGLQIWEKKLSFRPWNISTDHKNRILVSNTKDECVTIYNEDGVELLSFPAATDQRKLKPVGLCVDDEDNILVVDGNSKSVLLYDPRGEFQNKLVDIEGDPGIYPYRVALHSDRYLAVSGGRNLRLYKL